MKQKIKNNKGGKKARRERLNEKKIPRKEFEQKWQNVWKWMSQKQRRAKNDNGWRVLNVGDPSQVMQRLHLARAAVLSTEDQYSRRIPLEDPQICGPALDRPSGVAAQMSLKEHHYNMQNSTKHTHTYIIIHIYIYIYMSLDINVYVYI